MNKRGLTMLFFAFAFVLFLAVFAVAQENTTAIDNAYSCLNSKIAGKNLTLQEDVFSVLALGSTGNVVDAIGKKQDSSNPNAVCWPAGACKIKDTAQVALAYNRIGKDNSAVKKWLYSKNTTASELKWLLEIDITSKVASSCTIKDSVGSSTVKILDDSTLQISGQSRCFVVDNNYMLAIKSACLNDNFDISCDQDFVTSTLYQRSTGGTLFILPDTHSATSQGTTTERVDGQCFKSGSACDYEGTLWAAFALKKSGDDVSKFVPYLLALSDDNDKYFPNTFLYILVGGDDQANQIIQQQQQGEFWEKGGGRYYDTSLAMLALVDGAEVEAARTYLLGIQAKDGCWNSDNVRDTAFILYSGWPRGVGSVGEVSSPALCESPFSCENLGDCTSAGGFEETSYTCLTSEICCSKSVSEQTCAQLGGQLCSVGQEECSGTTARSSDATGICCTSGSCSAIPQDNCSEGTCESSCASGEIGSTTGTCINGNTCCVAAQSSSLWFWIVFLIILIIIIVLGIIYRDKVRVQWFKFNEWIRTKFGKKPVAQVQARQSMPQRSGTPYAPFTRPMPQQPMQQPRMPMRPVAKDKEMEEALRKLREMSKK